MLEAQAVAAFPQDASQRRLAHLDRLSAKVIAIQLQKVEGVEERRSSFPRWRSNWNVASPRSSQPYHPPVDQAGTHPEVTQRYPLVAEAVNHCPCG